ncbi:MAG: hypothetical protein OEL89_05315 [Candidatus Peregrinibacteria bacterium]|nr:hypothetical protein [Candidatus Peregrinibacteria bacterium]
MDKCETLIKKYEGQIPEEVADALRDNSKRIITLEENAAMLSHELAGSALAMETYFKFIRKNPNLSPKEIGYLEGGQAAAERYRIAAGILQLNTSSEESLLRNRTKINLEEVMDRFYKIHKPMMRDNDIGLRKRYNLGVEPFGQPAIFDIIWGTLMGNAMNSALPNFYIQQAFGNFNGNLEILMENVHDGTTKRRAAGMGEGRGLKFIGENIHKLGGTMETYKEFRISDRYDIDERLKSFKSQKPTKDHQIFGVKLTIPLKNITA